MYPYLRMAYQMWVFRKAPRLALGEAHISHHLCWPQDIDPWLELNNGRTLTLMDLGRIPMGQRCGLNKVVREKKWGMAVAGASNRYRRRVRLFDKIEMHTRLLGWDERFVYIDQSMWKSNGECANQVLIRSAVTDKNGIVAPKHLAEALGYDTTSPPLPEWVERWIEADKERPWPPVG